MSLQRLELEIGAQTAASNAVQQAVTDMETTIHRMYTSLSAHEASLTGPIWLGITDGMAQWNEDVTKVFALLGEYQQALAEVDVVSQAAEEEAEAAHRAARRTIEGGPL